MKKLSILCGVLLLVGLLSGAAYSQSNYCLDWDDDGSCDNGIPQNIDPSGVDVTATIGLYLENYSCTDDGTPNSGPNDTVFGGQTYIGYDSTSITVTGCTEYSTAFGGVWDPAPLSSCEYPSADVIKINTASFFYSFVVVGGKVKMATLEIECIAQDLVGFDFLVSDTNVVGSPGDGVMTDCNLNNTNPADASFLLTQAPPPCACEITGPASVAGSAIATVTAAYTASQVAGTFCANTPAYQYSDTCTAGDVDPNTGVLTVGPYIDPTENCQVCADDTANSITPCCTDVAINPGQTCDGEIYLGGDPGFCAENCEAPQPVDDPPFNRPGRRGLALTCGDVVDFCACDDCEQNQPVLEWTVCCDDPSGTFACKPDAAAIVATSDCTARLTVGDVCQNLSEVLDCTVTVTDTVNNWTDSVDIQIGKLTVDLGEVKVTPDTDSIEVPVSLTNNDHTVRALDITIAECDDADNIACTECVVDPDRALGFTCTASELPNGYCRLVMYSAVDTIAEGDGQIATVIFDQIGDDCPDCIDLCITAVEAADQFNEPLCTCTDTGEVCFNVCGDIYPQDCLDPGCKPCGDDVVDLFDILEMVDIILGLQTATQCQLDNGDVPNGMPPYCGNPPAEADCETDGEINIFDLLVIIDMALDKPNCCDYCATGAIY